MAAVQEAHRRGLPLVALKLGASATSGDIAVTHTASMVGSDEAYGALFRRYGVRRVHSVPELLDTLAVLETVGPLRGNRVVSLSCSGGEASLVADCGEGLDLDFVPFTPAQASRIDAALEGRVAVTNPLDYHTFIWGDLERLTECFTTVLGVDTGDPVDDLARAADLDPFRANDSAESDANRGFDAALLVLDLPADGLDRSRWWPTLDAFGVAGVAGVVTATLSENMPEVAREKAASWGLATCGDLDNALAVIEAAQVWGCLLARASTPGSEPAELEPSRHLQVAQDPQPLPEDLSKQILHAAGIKVPPAVTVAPEDAASAARELGFPVVVEGLGVAHKSDVGAVEVGLTDSDSVVRAARRMGKAGLRKLLIERYVEDAVAELMVSIRSCEPIGMLLTLAAGGVLVEVLDDKVSLLLPVSADDIAKALNQLKVWPLLTGHRSGAPSAIDQVITTVEDLCSLVCHDSRITEVEINPLLATTHDAIAVDALVVTEGSIEASKGGSR